MDEDGSVLVNNGVRWWSDGVDVERLRRIRPQSRPGTGFNMRGRREIEAAPATPSTGGGTYSGGEDSFQTTVPPPNAQGVTAFESAVALPEGIQKLTLVPGLKVNLKGSLLLSLNALTALYDTGLHARFTPVVGLDLTF